MMCAGAIVQFGIPRVVVGEERNFDGSIGFLSERGVEVALIDDPDCIELMGRFIREKPGNLERRHRREQLDSVVVSLAGTTRRRPGTSGFHRPDEWLP